MFNRSVLIVVHNHLLSMYSEGLNKELLCTNSTDKKHIILKLHNTALFFLAKIELAGRTNTLLQTIHDEPRASMLTDSIELFALENETLDKIQIIEGGFNAFHRLLETLGWTVEQCCNTITGLKSSKLLTEFLLDNWKGEMDIQFTIAMESYIEDLLGRDKRIKLMLIKGNDWKPSYDELVNGDILKQLDL